MSRQLLGISLKIKTATKRKNLVIHINSHPYVFGPMKWGGGDVAFGYSDNRTSNCNWPDCVDLVVSGFPQHPLKLM